MSAPTQRFTTARSMEMLDQIAAALAEMGRATVKELSVRSKLSPGQTAQYVLELERTGRAHCAQEAMRRQGGQSGKVWAAGPAPGAELRTLVDAERCVVVRKRWPPHHVRDVLDCYLFGAPARAA
jgi:hypothetical protein